MSKTHGIKTGEIVKTCPVTGKKYRMTQWEVRGNRKIALEKELVEEESEDYDE